VPNAADVLSNLGFALAGLWGLWFLRRAAARAALGAALPGYVLFFVALVLTAFGSGWYHLAPDDARLLWDRLPIALACAGLLAGARAASVAPRQGIGVTFGLAILGVASVAWWALTGRAGEGDLRPYLLLQGAPLVLIPIWQALAGRPRRERIAFGIAIALYVLAKAAEIADRALLDTLGALSGHTLKHLLATAASFVLVAHARLLGSDSNFPDSARDRTA